MFSDFREKEKHKSLSEKHSLNYIPFLLLSFLSPTIEMCLKYYYTHIQKKHSHILDLLHMHHILHTHAHIHA